MGSKKHKKHKSERRERIVHEVIDKPPEPLRLVLKVGGSSASEHGDSPHVQPHPEIYIDDRTFRAIEKHKKSKKKKKKKSAEREREKKHKHHFHHHNHEKKEKRKRERDESGPDESEIAEEVPEPPPIKRPLVVVEEEVAERPFREPRACTLKNRQSKSSLQLLLDHLLKDLERKDPQQFFAWPVTDHIAPGYSSIILHPMDFSTMRQKIENNEYGNVADFKADFKLMCDNAMIYNRPDTIYYKCAKRLLHQGIKSMTKEKLAYLVNTLPNMTELGRQELGFDMDDHISPVEMLPEDTTDVVPVVKEVVKPVIKPLKPSKFVAFEDDLSPDEILAQAQQAAKDAATRLTLRKPTSKFAFLRQRQDGTTSLAVVPLVKKEPKEDEKVVTLEMLVGKLNHGTGSLTAPREDKRNVIKPVSYMNYGSYSSYAPNYDSMFSNLTKEESDLLYATYGDDAGIQYAESILNFSKDCDYVTGMVDNLLDILTDGEHSKAMRVLEESAEQKALAAKEKEEENCLGTGSNINFQSLRSLSEVGIDVSFLDALEKEVKIEKAPAGDDIVQKKLDETTGLLHDLERVQHARLSAKLPMHLSQIAPPSKEEVHLAEKVIENLKELSKQATPGDVSSVMALRKSMGISNYPSFSSEDTLERTAHSSSTTTPTVPEVDLEVVNLNTEIAVSPVTVDSSSCGVPPNIDDGTPSVNLDDPVGMEEEQGVTDLETEIQKFLEDEPQPLDSTLEESILE